MLFGASKHDHKNVKFQHDQPPIRPIFDPQDAPHMAENDDEPVVFEPDDAGQQIEALEGHLQPQNNAENGVENDVQQPIVDDFIMPPDVDPLPDKVDHWVVGMKLSMLSSDHPESDGRTERMNQTFEDMLRAYVSHRQSDWERYLPQLEFAYNNSKHFATSFSSFTLMYEFDPKSPIAFGLEKVKDRQARDFLSNMQEMRDLAEDSVRTGRDRVMLIKKSL
ncbi:hypothetical protein L7F22_030019 [Adiantum nelumboides]|nr:hypothetical protein [Adiantum nelumboides]